VSGVAARLFPRDLKERARCDEIIRAVRRELASKALGRAAEMRATEAQAN